MKRLLYIAALLAAGLAHAQLPTYTIADVAQHASASNCWMVLNSNQTYNFTNYIALHPGANAMVPYCGKDGTQAFSGLPHSARAIALQPSYLIGTLVVASLPISVSLTPASGLTTVGQSLQFALTVNNSTQGVAWTLVPASLGTISASGQFTATTVGSGTITATSLEDTSKFASANVTVNATTPPPPNTVAVAMTPSAVTVRQGSRVRFRATVTNSTTGVTWSTTGTIGTIDANGVFTAGTTVGTGTVVATSVDDPRKAATSQVTVTAPTAGNVCTPGNRPEHRSDD
jgi:hypothetical protein